MKRQKRNWLISICGAFAALTFIVGAWFSMPTVEADAATAPVVTMVPGASARKTENDPGIKFTATIHNFDSSYDYGMLILPEAAWYNCGWDNNTDYIKYFTDKGITEDKYVNKVCGVFTNEETGEKQIALSLNNILKDN